MAVKRSRRLRLFGLLAVLVILVVFGSIVVPPLVLRDAAAPAHIEPFLSDARARLYGEAVRLLPLHLRFVEARCRRDGGALLVFEQWELPYLGSRYGYVMSGTWPPTGWGGGVGMIDLRGDPEIAAFMGTDEVPCESASTSAPS
jgi:hypothetical protein